MDENSVTRVLLLSANPKDTDQLRLNEEFREIREGLNLSANSALFDIKQGGATRAKDLRRLIFSFNPHIIHFSGHSSSDGIFLESDTGRYNPVTGYALANLFSLFSGTVKCVILNACYSREQAIEIVQQIPYVVGMSTRIRDDSAIQFAIGFYDALGAGRGIEDAYKFGCNAIQLEGGNRLGGSDRSLVLPVSDASDLEKYTDIDEADKPVLLTRVREVKSTEPMSDVRETPAVAPITRESITPIPEKVEPLSPSSSPSLSSPAPSSASPHIDKKTSNKLPWILLSLIPLAALSFVLWDYYQKVIVQEEPVEQVVSEEQPVVEQADNQQKVLVTPALVAPTKEKTVEKERTNLKEAISTEKTQATEQANNKKEVEARRLREAKVAEKEKQLAAREQAIKKAEVERRGTLIRAAAAKKKRLKEKRKELAAVARRKREERARKQWEEQQRETEARKAWQSQQDEIKRQQAEKQRLEQLQQQKAAEAKRQQALQQAQSAKKAQPVKKESAADKMVREVEELWFDRN